MKEQLSQSLEKYFQQFKEDIIGSRTFFNSPYGTQPLLYADWVASGRLYEPIEILMKTEIGSMIANPHSFSSETGKASTYAYRHARQIIKSHVNASKDDVLIASGTGMTSLLSRLQRIMGLRVPNIDKTNFFNSEEERPVVFISHMEHHSNQVPWMETIADVVIVPCNEEQLVSPNNLEKELKKYADRKLKIGAFTACSNVTGIITPYHDLAKVMHKYNGFCIVDFAASAPYVEIDMHPKDELEHLDAILFSPHKFLGGPGSCGVLVFNKELYKANVPDVPGGGNVKWTNPWGDFVYSEDLETREDGGTPGFLQVMRAALAIRLKEKMGVKNIENRESELLTKCFNKLNEIPGLFILGSTQEKRIGCVSFGISGIHYNLIVRLLNDRFGIQVRGGWSCASTYAHYLLELSEEESSRITHGIDTGNLKEKPGWVRLSLHPVTTDEELNFICKSIRSIVAHISEWQKDYKYNASTNEFEHVYKEETELLVHVKEWFNL